MVMQLKNREARRLWLALQGMSAPKIPNLEKSDTRLDEVLAIIRTLGFVQLDSIQITARAHHHILWSRNPHYREYMLDDLMEARKIFEHFTHDASILPMEFYPYWARQFKKLGDRSNGAFWGKHLPPPAMMRKIFHRIEKEGPLCSRDFKGKADKSVHLWMRPPHKLALDFMWYGGRLATSHRHNFQKYYDLKSRIIPAPIAAQKHDKNTQINWLCHEALKRLGFGTHREIQKFWDVVSLDEVKKWIATSDHIIELDIEADDGAYRRHYALNTIDDMLAAAPAPSSRLRILNPFDPLIRDRKRLEMLFGFAYKIEIFTPASKRHYGYYVCPLLEKDKFVGRIEVRADRKNKILRVENLWLEDKVSLSASRKQKLNAELRRMAQFTGSCDIEGLF